MKEPPSPNNYIVGRIIPPPLVVREVVVALAYGWEWDAFPPKNAATTAVFAHLQHIGVASYNRIECRHLPLHLCRACIVARRRTPPQPYMDHHPAYATKPDDGPAVADVM